jgi:hypothetical protein
MKNRSTTIRVAKKSDNLTLERRKDEARKKRSDRIVLKNNELRNFVAMGGHTPKVLE